MTEETMYEDALAFPLFGTQIYAYGLAVMLGCWLGLGLLIFMSRRQPQEKKAAAYAGVLMIPLGFILARLMYCLLDPAFAPLLSVRNILDIRTGGYAMYGALIGAAAAVLIGARLAGVRTNRMLDLLSPALLAFLVPARLGEGFTALGISRPLTTDWLAGSFLAMQDDYDAYLRTYLLEALIAALLLFILLRFLSSKPKDGQTFMFFCLLYGITQTLMESLRYDGHLRYSFIGVQQVLSAALFSIALAVMAARLLKKTQGSHHLLPILSLALIPLILGAIIGVEFLVDRSELGKLFSYGLYVLVLSVPAALGLLMLKQEVHLGKKTR
jgi:phosphatidylglycerol:prolipoprotein diacylglycerol transferase